MVLRVEAPKSRHTMQSQIPNLPLLRSLHSSPPSPGKSRDQGCRDTGKKARDRERRWRALHRVRHNRKKKEVRKKKEIKVV